MACLLYPASCFRGNWSSLTKAAHCTQPHIIDATVNQLFGHKAGVAGIYYRATYAAEQSSTLSTWAEYVRTIVDSDVTTLRMRLRNLGMVSCDQE